MSDNNVVHIEPYNTRNQDPYQPENNQARNRNPSTVATNNVAMKVIKTNSRGKPFSTFIAIATSLIAILGFAAAGGATVYFLLFYHPSNSCTAHLSSGCSSSSHCCSSKDSKYHFESTQHNK